MYLSRVSSRNVVVAYGAGSCLRFEVVSAYKVQSGTRSSQYITSTGTHCSKRAPKQNSAVIKMKVLMYNDSAPIPRTEETRLIKALLPVIPVVRVLIYIYIYI